MQQGKYMSQQIKENASESDQLVDSQNTELQSHIPVQQSQHVDSSSLPSEDDNIIPDTGRKLTFDNLDYRQEVHYMTEEHQNVDKHCVTYMSTENRVSVTHLSHKQPDGGVMEQYKAKR